MLYKDVLYFNITMQDIGRTVTPKPDKIAVISILIILFLISIPGVYAYYAMDGGRARFLTDTGQSRVVPEFQEASRSFNNRILLRKDKAFTVNKSRLVFRGIEDEKVRLDVYLLELDPEYAYPHYISTAKAGQEFQLGETRFRVLKMSRGTLQLEILEMYKS